MPTVHADARGSQVGARALEGLTQRLHKRRLLVGGLGSRADGGRSAGRCGGGGGDGGRIRLGRRPGRCGNGGGGGGDLCCSGGGGGEPLDEDGSPTASLEKRGELRRRVKEQLVLCRREGVQLAGVVQHGVQHAGQLSQRHWLHQWHSNAVREAGGAARRASGSDPGDALRARPHAAAPDACSNSRRWWLRQLVQLVQQNDMTSHAIKQSAQSGAKRGDHGLRVVLEPQLGDDRQQQV